MRKGIGALLLRYRLILVVLSHFALILLSNYLAFWLRFDGSIPPRYEEHMVRMFSYLVAIRGGVFLFYGLYKGLWRYTSIWDLWRIVFATLLSSALFFLLVHLIAGVKEYPRSIFIVDSVLLIVFLGGIRLPWRIHREMMRQGSGKKVLIYGAGDAGEMIARDMKQHPEYKYLPVGFIDDDPRKVKQSIHGIPVLGGQAALGNVIPKLGIEEIIFAIPSADPTLRRKVLSQLQPFKIPIKTTPNLIDILDEKVNVSQIRNLAIEDLMNRVPVDLDLSPVEHMLRGKRILVTGAAGSIGSELCRQIVKMEPEALILYDRNENGLYEIDRELTDGGYRNFIRGVIGDITAHDQVDRALRIHSPEILFHAAAHKHVPLMEENPCEAVRNNVFGTRILAKAAIQNGIGKFVLISTDKAVHPTSVMGATKRVAEMIVHSMAENSMTSFVSVRFGNVLASQGSVIPLFLSQIKKGGPVTVTHPDVQRYFMLIPEAVKLVLLASSFGGDAETYVLEMGEQIKVVEMARNLIRLSGLIPDVDVPIVFTGLRPGEKLAEQLVGQDEIATPSDHAKEISHIRPGQNSDPNFLRRNVVKLEEAALRGDEATVLLTLKALIPTYTSSVQMSAPSLMQDRTSVSFEHPTA